MRMSQWRCNVPGCSVIPISFSRAPKRTLLPTEQSDRLAVKCKPLSRAHDAAAAAMLSWFFTTRRSWFYNVGAAFETRLAKCLSIILGKARRSQDLHDRHERIRCDQNNIGKPAAFFLRRTHPFQDLATMST